jgi:aspartate aminotransferase
VDIIELAQGEPDFNTPEHVIEAATRAMREGQTHYTQVDGTPALKAAIIAKFKRENGLSTSRRTFPRAPAASRSCTTS